MAVRKEMNRTPRGWYLVLGVLVIGLVGCSDIEETTPVYKVSPTELLIEVPAHGELQAGDAKVISNPSRQPMTLAWMEN